MRISDWSSDVCSSDLLDGVRFRTVNVIGAVLLGCTTNAGNGNVTGAIDTYNGAENINVLGCTIRYFTYAGIKIQNSSNINVIGNIVTERSEEHTSELQSLMRISYAVFCLKKQKTTKKFKYTTNQHTNTKQSHSDQHHHTTPNTTK